MSWYKLANEFIGVDGISPPKDFIHQTRTRNIENEFLPPSITDIGYRRPASCPVCKQEIVESELMKGYHNQNGEMVFKCNNCGYTNSSDVQVVTLKNKKKKKRKKSQNDYSMNKKADAPGAPVPSGMDYNNPMNTPYGRVDLSEDARVIPWGRLDDSFRNEFTTNRQKGNRILKVINVKGKGGKPKKIVVKVPNTEEGFVGPQNVTIEKGKFKKQPRYNPKRNQENKKDAPGGWPQQRNPTKGFYGHQDDTYTFDADMRHRVIPWQDLIKDRSTNMLTLTKPI